LCKKELEPLKTINKVLAIGAAIVLIGFVLFLALSAAAPALSATLSALLAATSTPPPGEVIPLESIADLTSLNATVEINVNGLINGKRAQGDLSAVLTTNDQNESKVTVTGSLLGRLPPRSAGRWSVCSRHPVLTSTKCPKAPISLPTA
jgi:hypothetical protein